MQSTPVLGTQRAAAQSRLPQRQRRRHPVTIRWLIAAPVVWVALAALSAGATFTRAAAGPNDDCLACHAQPGLERSDTTRAGSLRVDARSLAASPHGALACTACHAGVPEIPHASRLPAVRCASCH